MQPAKEKPINTKALVEEASEIRARRLVTKDQPLRPAAKYIPKNLRGPDRDEDQ